MTEGLLLPLAPYIFLGVAAAVVMLVAAFGAGLLATAYLTGLAFLLALASVGLVLVAPTREATALLRVDNYALFYITLLLVLGFGIVLLSYAYLLRREDEGDHGAYFILLILAVLGAAALAASTHFASFFLALEVLSVSLYALVGYRYRRDAALEAGMKYLILAGASSAFLLFGMAMVYAEVGSLALADTAKALTAGGSGPAIFGLAVMTVGVGFKLAVVPFHLWTPDVYEGAPAPVTVLVATISKGGVFAVVLRYFGGLDLQRQESLFLALALVALLSMYVGNLLALSQSNVKRLLAYSSISHLGYLLAAFLAGGEVGAVAATFYLVAYAVTALGAFGVVSALSEKERDADAVADYQGLFWHRPGLAIAFAASLLSLAGMPLTVGFMGKFLIATAAIGTATGGLVGVTLWVLVVSLVLTSVVGLFYYLRLAATMFSRRAEPATAPSDGFGPATEVGLVLTGVVALLLVLGLFPTPVLDLIVSAVTSLP